MSQIHTHGTEKNVKQSNPYLIFNGNCRDAMQFYEKCLNGKLQLMTFADAPPMPGSEQAHTGGKDLIMHAHLASGPVVLMASDTQPNMPVKQADNFSININCESADEAERLFNAFSQGAQRITMPLAETFWAAKFGMLTDKFGIGWMFNYEKPRPQ
jgi:PhnB protein